VKPLIGRRPLFFLLPLLLDRLAGRDRGGLGSSLASFASPGAGAPSSIRGGPP